MAQAVLRQSWRMLCHKFPKFARGQRSLKRITAPSTKKKGLEPMLFRLPMELLLQIFPHLPLTYLRLLSSKL